MTDTLIKNSFWAGCRCGGKQRSPAAKCNSLIVKEEVKKPDLAIYSQEEALQKGIIPTWNNPDILGTNQEVFVRIRNLSPTVPAINALVHLYTSPYGIGTKKELKLTKVINLAAGAQTELIFPLDNETQAGNRLAGRHIRIEHPYDSKRVNNFGSRCNDIITVGHSEREWSVLFPVVNDSAFSREIKLSLMPSEFIASISPSSYLFSSHEQIIATLRIQIPDFLRGANTGSSLPSVTVIGRLSDGELIGGITKEFLITDAAGRHSEGELIGNIIEAFITD